MNARTYESPMDWEYNDRGPLDPTSPFAQAANNAPRSNFSSPFKSTSRPPNPFARLQSPTKSSAQPPQSARFTPQLPSSSTAPPFRNPAFTTPRKPVDEVVLSEASGVEDSPTPTEASDYPNDTPDVDRRTDIAIGATITPLKVDKSQRYGKAGSGLRKHASGKGEIRGARDVHVTMRKRRRHNMDKDVGSGTRHGPSTDDFWDSDSDASDGGGSQKDGRPKAGGKQGKQRGPFESFFRALNKYPHTPDHMQKWMQLGANVFLVSVATYVCWSVVSTIRTDIFNANSAAQQKLVSQMEGCRNHYTSNNCASNDRPALKAFCEEWYECMMQDPDAIMRVKVTAKQIAEIINEFTETMHLKAWGVIVAIILICATINFGSFGRQSSSHKELYPPGTQPPSSIQEQARSPDITPGYMLVPVQTPRLRRQALLDEGTDTDNSPIQPSFFTPSGRRSPSKSNRQLSPVRYRGSPSKGH
ncbi:Nucleus export protein Brr6 [Moelleriella libera RCEF 2490]|uniref:Nucleus export protein Brr6 n=1 Tax=Moelleriella libera RCEF 2490 TaxID=1081109 RepID=A0A167W6I1_9HYPO|nr:Nucleus export protein Brr6 [Moelleriella libera RCEF 2490]